MLLILGLLLAVGCHLPALAQGQAIESRTLETEAGRFLAASVELDRARLELHWRDPASGQAYGSISALRDLARTRGERLLFATNAGIYAADYAPLGLHIEDFRTLRPLNTAHGNPDHGNFSLLPNGVFSVDEDGVARVQTTADWQREHGRIRLATQSGPMLVVAGRVNARFMPESDSLKWRSGVCATAPRQATFVISLAPVNFYGFARVFLDQLHCRDALYLDGTLSQLYVEGHYYGPPPWLIKPWAGILAVFGPAAPAPDQPPSAANAAR